MDDLLLAAAFLLCIAIVLGVWMIDRRRMTRFGLELALTAEKAVKEAESATALAKHMGERLERLEQNPWLRRAQEDGKIIQDMAKHASAAVVAFR